MRVIQVIACAVVGYGIGAYMGRHGFSAPATVGAGGSFAIGLYALLRYVGRKV